MANANVKEFTDANFETEVLKSATPVLVDFWAEWCPPCKALGPIIDKLANDYAGKIKIGKLDSDSNRDMCLKFGINNLPTILFFKNGQVANKIVGFKKEADFKAVLDAI